MLEVFPRSIEGYGWITFERVDPVEEQYKECMDIIRSLNTTSLSENKINKYEQQLIRYSNYIHELQNEINDIKLENLRLKEELRIFRNDILDNYEKTVDNHR